MLLVIRWGICYGLGTIRMRHLHNDLTMCATVTDSSLRYLWPAVDGKLCNVTVNKKAQL